MTFFVLSWVLTAAEGIVLLFREPGMVAQVGGTVLLRDSTGEVRWSRGE